MDKQKVNERDTLTYWLKCGRDFSLCGYPKDGHWEYEASIDLSCYGYGKTPKEATVAVIESAKRNWPRGFIRG